MRAILIIILLLLFFKTTKKEFFCENLNNNQICNFLHIKLPIEKNFTLPEIKNYGELRAIDIYNEIFNSNNPRISDYISQDKDVNTFLLDLCYINKDNEVQGIINTVNLILKEKYFANESEYINSTTKINYMTSKIKFFRYKLLNKLFDEINTYEDEMKNLNMKIIKFHVIYLLLEEVSQDYIGYNIRYGIYSFLYDKNITISDPNNESNDTYQYIILIVKDVIKKYLFSFFGKNIMNIEDLSIKKLRNLINNGEIIDYFLLEKDLCYI